MKHNTVFLIAILCLFIVGTVSADTLNLSSASAGSVGRTTAGTFTAIRNGAGTFVDTGSTAYTQLDTNSGSSFSVNYRYSIQFNTSTLPDDCTITNVSVDVAGNSKSNTFSTSPGYGITRFSPATNGSLASSDYNKFNDTRFATDIPYASIDTSDRYGYNRWYFNSLGISNVSKTGFTNIMVRLSWDIDNSSPTAAASKTSYWEEHSTDTLRSVINITYTPAAGGDTTPPASITGLANTTTCNSINFTWTNPTTSDFNGTMNWLNGTVQANMTNTTTFKLVSGLTENLAVTLGTKTYDFTGNVNATFTNMTATTYTSVAANFTKNQTAGVQPLSLIFNDTSTGTTLTGWNWSFGDTTWQNGTTRNASKIYSSGGTYSVFLIGTNPCGSNTSATQTINIYNQTIANFTQNQTSVIVPPSKTVIFNTTSTNATWWNWSVSGTWYNSSSAATSNHSYTFSTGGNYTVNLTTSNAGYGSSTKNSFVNVYNQTVSGFTANVTNGLTPLAVLFTVSTVRDNATFWNWSFGDGTWQNGTTQNATKTYSSGGLYTVTEISNNPWTTNTTTRTNYIDVWNLSSNDFAANVTTGYVPTPILFTDTSYNSTSWTWIFGDGNTSNVQNATNVYTVPGVYSVNHSSTNAHHTYWTNKSNYINISANPVTAVFSADNVSVCEGDTITFTDASLNTTAWAWMFGEGNTSALQNPTFNYVSAGVYDVFLNASNPFAFDWENKTGYITVNDCTPPASISNLVGNLDNCTQINWTWTNPTDADYNGSMVYQDGVWLHNVTNTTSFDVWSGLTASTSYIFSARSFDITGNLNTTWVNVTKSTDACPTYPPVAQFSADNVSVCTYETIQFTDSSENATAWWWLFGDSQDSHIEDPTHFYDTVGVFNVSLRATNADGEDWENKTNYITVSDCSPPASITGLDHTNENCYNITWVWTNPLDPDYDHLMIYQNGVWLHNITTPTATDIWEGLSTLTNYTFSSHTVDATGNVNQTWVNLTGNTSYCVADTVASFTSNVTCGIIPFAAQYNDTSIGTNITAWFWDFGDGVNSTEQNPIINYTVTGIYGVDHSATGDTGTSWSNISGYMTARPLGDTCLGGGDNYDSDDYAGNWFTSWWF